MENSVNKLRVIKDYESLDSDLQEQIKLVYPEGYSQHLIEFTNAKGEKVSALRFETFDKIYLVRMSVLTAERLIEEDSDYDDDGFLKQDVKVKYAGEHADVEYLAENENYEIEDLESEDDYDD